MVPLFLCWWVIRLPIESIALLWLLTCKSSASTALEPFWRELQYRDMLLHWKFLFQVKHWAKVIQRRLAVIAFLWQSCSTRTPYCTRIPNTVRAPHAPCAYSIELHTHKNLYSVLPAHALRPSLLRVHTRARLAYSCFAFRFPFFSLLVFVSGKNVE